MYIKKICPPGDITLFTSSILTTLFTLSNAKCNVSQKKNLTFKSIKSRSKIRLDSQIQRSRGFYFLCCTPPPLTWGRPSVHWIHWPFKYILNSVSKTFTLPSMITWTLPPPPLSSNEPFYITQCDYNIYSPHHTASRDSRFHSPYNREKKYSLNP